MIIPINQYLVPLTQGKFAVVDAEGWEKVKYFKWHLSHGYAIRRPRDKNGKKFVVFMHRVIADTPDNLQTDHINMNKLDNRLVNLRVCTASENKQNCGKSASNISGYKGVSRQVARGKWQAHIKKDGKSKYLGLFDEIKDAARAYNQAAIKHFGKFARLNKIDG